MHDYNTVVHAPTPISLLKLSLKSLKRVFLFYSLRITPMTDPLATLPEVS